MSARCKYLIYTSWTSLGPSGSVIGGSLLHDLCPQTEEEAKQMVATLAARSETLFDKILSLQERRYIYIKNKDDWWPPERPPERLPERKESQSKDDIQ